MLVLKNEVRIQIKECWKPVEIGKGKKWILPKVSRDVGFRILGAGIVRNISWFYLKLQCW
jgi:hypothetical protein